MTLVPSSKDCSIRFDDGPTYGSRAARFCREAFLGVLLCVAERLADNFFLATFFEPAIRTLASHSTADAPAGVLTGCQKGRRVFGVST